MYSISRLGMNNIHSQGRLHREKFHDRRGCFERDRDRIIHSEAFRKLEYKTQVFINHADDYFRTRLTHTMEVAQIARGIAKMLRVNMELVEAIALAHDLGHTPFGHTGEEILNTLVHDFGGFEHNMQSYRVVTYLEERYPDFRGLNLTFETLEGIIKHSTPFDSPHTQVLHEIFDMTKQPTIEAQIIDYADEIAYLNHDLDDGLFSGLLTWEELETVTVWQETVRKIRRRFPTCDDKDIIKHRVVSMIISLFMNDLVDFTRAGIKRNHIETVEDVRLHRSRLVGLNPEINTKKNELRAFLYKKMYFHPNVERMRITADRCIKTLFEIYMDHPTILPQKYRKELDKGETARERIVADAIAGMTDRAALEEYRRLHSGL